MSDGHSGGSRDESAAELRMRTEYGYTRRPGQSRGFVTVPMALLQEAHDGCAAGDSKTLLRTILMKARRHEID